MPLQRSPSKFIRSNMNRLRRSIRESFRRRSGSGSPSERNVAGGGGGSGNDGKPQLWSQDEATVRAGTCAYPVKYLGSVEVGESRGMQVCEEALKVLRAGRRRPVKGVLYVSGDGIRVVDSESKGLVVDQTIEKVSFCAPDRNHEKGFAYICRDGTTRRWMCHGFHASKDSGERLSHAVGCAFAVCLERKQKRDREAQQALNAQQLPRSQGSSNNGTPSHVSDSTLSQTSTNDTAAFQRHSLFRQSTLSERLQDPQNAKPSEKPPVRPAFNPHAIARPAGNRHLFERQGSLRMAQVPLKEATEGTTVDGGQQDMFRRFNSLRINQLPSNLERVEQNVNVVGQSAIIEEETSHFPVNSTGGGNLNLYGAQCNSSYFSPPASEVGSPSSHTRSASFDTPLTNGQGAVTGGSSYPTVSTGAAANPVGFSRANGGANWAYSSGRLTGSEWLETAAKQAKLLQHQIPSSTPVPQLAQQPINNDKKTPSSIQNAPPPPSFAPPPLPRPVQHQSSVVGVPVTSRPPSLMANSPARSLDLGSTQPVSTGGTDFDARWNALAGQQEPKVMEPVRNPFSQESTEVNI